MNSLPPITFRYPGSSRSGSYPPEQWNTPQVSSFTGYAFTQSATVYGCGPHQNAFAPTGAYAEPVNGPSSPQPVVAAPLEPAPAPNTQFQISSPVPVDTSVVQGNRTKFTVVEGNKYILPAVAMD
jgi:hypothetical protein